MYLILYFCELIFKYFICIDDGYEYLLDVFEVYLV